MHLALYISGHGFGHLAQVAPVINALAAIDPALKLLIRTALPKPLLQSLLNVEFTLLPGAVDVGVVQKSAIEEDREASITQMRRWGEGFDAAVLDECVRLKQFTPGLILSDISPLAFPVARALGVPGIGLATLDWFSIYRHWLPADDPMLDQLHRAYAMCDLLLVPPMAMQMQSFESQQSIPLIAMHPRPIDFDFKPGYTKRALILFGGSARPPPFDLQALGGMDEWLFLLPDATGELPENVQSIRFDGALRTVDLINRVDLVVCKPGYGVLSECWQTGAPIAWVERPDFPEFPMLRQWLENRFPATGMSRSDFAAGHWQAALDGAMNSARRFPPIVEDGAVVAAEALIRCHSGQ